MKFKSSISDILLIVFIILECYLLFYTKGKLEQTTNATLYAGCSLLIGLILLYKFQSAELESVTTTKKVGYNKILSYVLLIAGITPLAYMAILENNAITQFPLDHRQSDVIPMVQHMVQRLLTGEYVYKPIYDFGYMLSPTYMPLHWMPFAIPETMHFDYRWMAFILWSIATAILIIQTFKTNNYSVKLLTPIGLYLFYYNIFLHDKTVIGNTLELTIAAYYMLLVVGINKSSAIATGITITLCLMSRYSLVLWLPLWFFVMMVSGERTYAIKTTGIVVMLVIIVYVLPFLSKDPHIYGNTISQYLRAAIGEWEHINPSNGKPYQLYSGSGFAHLFYEKLQDWRLEDAIKRLQKVHFLLTAGTSVILGIWYWFNRHKINNRIFLMASFKIYFTIFLAFIQVPYVYLMIVANFVSIALFTEQMRYRIVSYK